MITRSVDLLNDVINGLNVPNNFAFLPHRRLIPAPAGVLASIHIDGKPYVATGLLTLCNVYANAATTALGCAIPPMKANEQALWLASNEGKLAGWTECDKPTAITRVSLGYPVVPAAINPLGHGHIGIGAPEPIIPGQVRGADLYVSAAGASNYARVRFEVSFGALAARTKFYTHP